MSDAWVARQRQLLAWWAVANADPARHAHQRVALRREVALCRSAASMDDYLRASDSGFEVTRANWLDQQAMHLRVAQALGQRGVAQGAWRACRQAHAALGQRDWVAAVQRGGVELALAQARQAQAESGFMRTLLNLLPYFGGEPWQGNPWEDAVEGWRSACDADPTLAVAVAQGQLEAHPLALRLPWRGPALNLLQGWLQALPALPALPELTAAALPPGHDPLVLQQAAQQAWAEALQPPGAAVPDQAFSPEDEGPGLVALTLRQQLKGLQPDGADTWPEPLLRFHAADTLSRLQACRNPLQVLQLSTWASACLALESAWQQLLVSACTLPLRAAVAVVLLGDTLRPGLVKAVQVAHALTGCGPRALLQQAEMQRRLQHLALHLAPPPDGCGGEQAVGLCEAGVDLLAPLSGWLAMQVACKGVDAATLCHNLPAALAATLDDLSVSEPESLPLSVQLWRGCVPFTDWPSLMVCPPRPEVPGLPLPPMTPGPHREAFHGGAVIR